MKPAPPISVYARLPDSGDYVAFFTVRGKHLPIYFQATSEARAVELAQDWWAAEQAKLDKRAQPRAPKAAPSDPLGLFG